MWWLKSYLCTFWNIAVIELIPGILYTSKSSHVCTLVSEGDFSGHLISPVYQSGFSRENRSHSMCPKYETSQNQHGGLPWRGKQREDEGRLSQRSQPITPGQLVSETSWELPQRWWVFRKFSPTIVAPRPKLSDSKEAAPGSCCERLTEHVWDSLSRLITVRLLFTKSHSTLLQPHGL